MYPIYIIHLESAKNRADLMQSQFNRLNINFNFFLQSMVKKRRIIHCFLTIMQKNIFIEKVETFL